MSIFDDLSYGSSKKAGKHGAKKSSGKISKRPDNAYTDLYSDADTEFASDMNAGNSDTTGVMWNNNRMADEEIASDYVTDRNQYGTQTYSHAGVAFNKLSDGEARIDYQGLLEKSGATEVTAVYGFGSNQNWENVSMVTLTKDASGKFVATVPIESGKNVNFAFRDPAQNWDNNSGLNYTFVN